MSEDETEARSRNRTRPVRSEFYCHACEREFQQYIQESEEPSCTACGSTFCEKISSDPPPPAATTNHQPIRVQHTVHNSNRNNQNVQHHMVQLHMDLDALENNPATLSQQIMQQISSLNLPGVPPGAIPQVSFGGALQNINGQNLNLGNMIGGVMGMATGADGQTRIAGNPANFAWGPDGMQNILDRLLAEAGPEQGPRALEEENINRIHTYELSTRQVNKLKDDNCADCTVCMAEFQSGDLVKKLPPCGHIFHCDCIDSWLRQRRTCPVCRAEVQIEANVPYDSGAAGQDSEPQEEEEPENRDQLSYFS